MDIPKVFWAFYDLFRRNQITFNEFSEKTGISQKLLVAILEEISKM